MFKIFISLIYRFKLYIKYLISGGTAFLVDIALLYLMTHYGGIHYLWSAVLAFSGAFFVSFFMQKFWTFRDNEKKGIARQMYKYFAVGIMNLGLNTALMYLFVDKLKIWYILAQVIATALIAITSFLIYNFYIFNTESGELSRKA
jgi:putative flippase GtrA